jgi:hypothetical protein
MTHNPLIPLDDALRAVHETAEPSAELEQRVVALAAAAEAPAPLPVVRSALRWSLALGAAVAVMAGVTFLSPRWALAESLQQASRNLLQAHELHYRVDAYTANGRLALRQEGWWTQRGRLRVDTTAGGRRSSTIQKDGKTFQYDPARGAASYTTGESGMTPPRVTMEPVSNAAKAGPPPEDLGIEIRNGHRIQKAAVRGPVQSLPWEPAAPGRTVVWVDLDRLVPVVIEAQVPRNGGWSPILRMEFEFDGAVPDETFSLPPGVRLYDQQAFGLEVGKRFERPLARQQAGARTVTLRDAQINRDGDVFVLYTDGSTPQRIAENDGELTDDRGTRYTPKTGGFTPRGIVTHGEAMRGFCFVPVEPAGPAKGPRRLRLTIRPQENGSSRQPRQAATFSIAAPAHRTGLFPSYAAELVDLAAADGADPARFRLDREQARRVYFYNRDDPRGVIRSSDGALRRGVSDAATFLDRAAAFERLGRFAETRAAIRRARELDELGSHADVIGNAERSLQQAEASAAHRR